MDLTIIAAMDETGIPERLNFRGLRLCSPPRNLFSRRKKSLVGIVEVETLMALIRGTNFAR